MKLYFYSKSDLSGASCKYGASSPPLCFCQGFGDRGPTSIFPNRISPASLVQQYTRVLTPRCPSTTSCFCSSFSTQIYKDEGTVDCLAIAFLNRAIESINGAGPQLSSPTWHYLALAPLYCRLTPFAMSVIDFSRRKYFVSSRYKMPLRNSVVFLLSGFQRKPCTLGRHYSASIWLLENIWRIRPVGH